MRDERTCSVAREMPTWEKYFEAGVRLRKAAPEQHLVLNLGSVFRMALYQRADQFVALTPAAGEAALTAAPATPRLWSYG